jgi:hypothetical protein
MAVDENPNPALVRIPAKFGAYYALINLNNPAIPSFTPTPVVFPPLFGFYKFASTGVSNSAVPPADYPAVGR